MGLAGYIDRDKKNNDLLNDSYVSALGWSYYKKPNIKEVTKPNKKESRSVLGTFSHDIVLSSDFVTLYEKNIKDLIKYMDTVKVKDLRSYCQGSKKNTSYWLAFFQTQYREIWEQIKQVFKMSEIYIYDEYDCEMIINFFLNPTVAKKMKYKLIYNYFLCRISGMQELDSDEKEFVKRYDENIENYKRLLNKKNELNSEISCYQSLISELEKIIQEDEDKKINLLAMEDIKKKLCSFENELEIIEKQISDSEEFRKTNADKYDELSYILIYGNRWSYVKNSMRKNEF